MDSFMQNEMTTQAMLQKFKIEGDWALFNKLTNNRPLKNNTGMGEYQEKVLKGYDKIINLVNKRVK